MPDFQPRPYLTDYIESRGRDFRHDVARFRATGDRYKYCSLCADQKHHKIEVFTYSHGMAPVQSTSTRTFCCRVCNDAVKDMILGIEDRIDPLEPTNFNGPFATKRPTAERLNLWIEEGKVDDTIAKYIIDNPNADTACYFCERRPNGLNAPKVMLETFHVPVSFGNVCTGGIAHICTNCTDLITTELRILSAEHPTKHIWARCSDCTEMYTIDDIENSYREGLTDSYKQCPACFYNNRRTITDGAYGLRGVNGKVSWNTRVAQAFCTSCSSRFSIDLMSPLNSLLEDYPNMEKIKCNKCRILPLPPASHYVFHYNRDIDILVKKAENLFHYQIEFKEDNKIIKTVPSIKGELEIQDAVCMGFAEVDRRILLDSFQAKIWPE